MKKGLALLTTLGLAITGCTTNVFAADVVIKLADVQAENDVETQFEYKFAELVKKKAMVELKSRYIRLDRWEK